MDKLELDDRVTKLEHRLSFLTALTLGVLVLLGASTVVILLASRELRPTPPAVTASMEPAVVATLQSPFS
jgi:hypothetical protein